MFFSSQVTKCVTKFEHKVIQITEQRQVVLCVVKQPRRATAPAGEEEGMQTPSPWLLGCLYRSLGPTACLDAQKLKQQLSSKCHAPCPVQNTVYTSLSAGSKGKPWRAHLHSLTPRLTSKAHFFPLTGTKKSLKPMRNSSSWSCS